MSKIRKWIMRRLHLGSASSPPPSNTPPGTIAGSSKSPLRAVHESEWSALPVENKSAFRAIAKRIVAIVFNASGATDGPGLVRLLERETGLGEAHVVLGIHEDVARFIRDGEMYRIEVVPASQVKAFPLYAHPHEWHHLNLIFTYDAASQPSRDEATAAYDDIRGRCENGTVPFTTLLLAMRRPNGPNGPNRPNQQPAAPAVPESTRGYLTGEYSPITGRGICAAFASLVEHTYAVEPNVPPDLLLRTNTPNPFDVLFDSACR